MTLEGGIAAVYSSTVVWTENSPLVSGESAEDDAARFGLYSMTKNASTRGASAGMS